jgi:proliferating cell nuclear antigen
MDSKNCIEIKTVQSAAFKVLIEALKELLTDTAIEISPKGLKIVTMDNSHVVLVHMILHGEKFEQFYCETPRVIGINMLNFYKIIKTINTNDTLTLFMESNDINHLHVRIDKQDKDTSSTYKLNTIDINYERISIPATEFTTVITLPASDFQKICRDMSNIADSIDITKVSNKLLMSCTGDFCTQETVITSDTMIETDGDDTEIIQGVYNIKYLVLFTKCTNLSNTVEIYLKNDYPLIVKYTVASLGDIKLCVSPQVID